MTKNKKMLCTGAGGTIVVALCCFTPLLVVLLGAVGLSAWLGWLDYVLFPALAAFILLTLYALYRQRRYPDSAGATTSGESGGKS
ncbi:MAG: mercury resistance system transport protein MerF [Kiloniellaceae bacterium]|nr:mercury resistance system transport protein MerF [Kiloniellaceae bacterium]